MILLAHKIRLDPTAAQEAYFRRACGTARFAWNWGLAKWGKEYEAGNKPSGQKLRKEFNLLKKTEFKWAYEVCKDAGNQPFRDLQTAFGNFFRRVKQGQKPGYPKFKCKGKSKDSFYIANDQFNLAEKLVHIPKLGFVKMREKLRFKGKILAARISRIADQWFISIQVDMDDYAKARSADANVGVDLGIKTTATLSDGTTFNGPKALRTNLKKLKRLNKDHSRKKKGSKNKEKSRVKLSRLYLKISSIRNDFLHKLSNYLCKNHAKVGIEDLNVKGMVKNRKLSRAISDEAWGELRRQIEYKANIYGTEIVVHNRWYPSSKLCSSCGAKKAELDLGTRIYECESCGFVLDRDLNAVINLKPVVEGSSKTLNACGVDVIPGAAVGDVGLSTVKQEIHR